MARSASASTMTTSSRNSSSDAGLGLMALGAFAFMIGMNVLTTMGIISSPPPIVAAKYWTALTPAGWTFGIWFIIYVLIGAYLSIGTLMTFRGRTIPSFGPICKLLAPNLILNGLWSAVWGQDHLWLALLIQLGMLSTNFVMYAKVMGDTKNAYVPACNANDDESRERLVDSESSNSKCPASDCTKLAVQTLWIRVYHAWVMAAFFIFLLVVWKYAVWGEVPYVEKTPTNSSLRSKVVGGVMEVVKTKVVGGGATLSAVEGVAATVALLTLVGISSLFALIRNDAVPPAVFAWSSLGIAAHARTSAAASRLAFTGVGTVVERFATLMSSIGMGGLWKLADPKKGDGWWTVVYDVALGAAILHVMIAGITVLVKWQRMKSRTAKQRAVSSSSTPARQSQSASS